MFWVTIMSIKLASEWTHLKNVSLSAMTKVQKKILAKDED